MILSNLKDTTRISKVGKRVGRGIGSGKGKTCGRGHKGSGSRSGYTRRMGYEGGGMRLFKKLPTRGFTRGRFSSKVICALNFCDIERLFNDNETVNISTLIEKNHIKDDVKFLKILSKGDISKKIVIEAHFYSEASIRKLDEKKVKYKVIKW